MKYVGLLCYLLILVIHSTSSADNDLTITIEGLYFDVPELKLYPHKLLQNFIVSMATDMLAYFKHSSLGTSIKIIIQEDSAFLSIVNGSMNNANLKELCSTTPNKLTHSLTVLFVDAPNTLKSQVLVEKGGYCDRLKHCAIIQFRTWAENSINLARAIASSIGIDFDNSPSSSCKGQNTIMNMKYTEASIGLPYTWSECSKKDLKMFLKTDKSSCMRQLPVPVSSNREEPMKKLKIKLQLHLDLPYDGLNLNLNELRHKLKLDTEAYFNHDRLNVPFDLDIQYGKFINGTSNNAKYGATYLKYYCDEIKRSDNSTRFSVIITNKDIYVLDRKGKKNYDHVFDVEKGNYCDKSRNCAVIEHGPWSDDAFNLARVIARSLGISFDGTENQSCDDDETIMSPTYDGLNIPTKWSQCSRNDFGAFITSDKSSCLNNVHGQEKLKDIEVGIQLHFLQNKESQRITRENLKNKARSIVEKVQQLLLRPKLDIVIKLKLDNAKLLTKEPSMTVHTMNKYCTWKTNKMGQLMFSVLLVEDLSGHYSLNKPWEADVMAVPLSMCDTQKNCAVINWKSDQETALALSRALAMSLGAPIDADPFSNCTEDDTIMSPGPAMVDSTAEWSSCSNDGITNYLKSDKSACLQHVNGQSTSSTEEERKITEKQTPRISPSINTMNKIELVEKHQTKENWDPNENKTPRFSPRINMMNMLELAEKHQTQQNLHPNEKKTSSISPSINMMNMIELAEKHQTQQNLHPNNINELEVNIKLHFVKRKEDYKFNGQALNNLTQSIMDKVKELLSRPNLNLAIKLNLVDLSFSMQENTMSYYSLRRFCVEEARQKKKNFTFSVLLLEEVNNEYSINHPWEADVFINQGSICDDKRNCAIMNWSDEYTTAVTLSRALVISLGATIDAAHISNCTEDDSIMSPGPAMVDAGAEWSSCTKNSIMNFLNSDASRCLREEHDRTQEKKSPKTTETLKTPNDVNHANDSNKVHIKANDKKDHHTAPPKKRFNINLKGQIVINKHKRRKNINE